MTALLIIDVQNDFLPGGSLPVPDGDAVIPVINDIQSGYSLIALTQDWHPPDHQSFASNHPGHQPLDEIQLDGREQVLWPDHCVWASRGAAIAADLESSRAAAIFRKGMDRQVDSYSGFFDNQRRRKTALAEWLRALGASELHIVGLAAEYCVAFTARDAVDLGFKTTILSEATRPISVEKWGETKRKLREFGVVIEGSGR